MDGKTASEKGASNSDCVEAGCADTDALKSFERTIRTKLNELIYSPFFDYVRQVGPCKEDHDWDDPCGTCDDEAHHEELIQCRLDRALLYLKGLKDAHSLPSGSKKVLEIIEAIEAEQVKGASGYLGADDLCRSCRERINRLGDGTFKWEHDCRD